MCFLWVFFLLFFFCLFLSFPDLSVFVLSYYYSLDVCLLYNKRQKGCGFSWEGGQEDLGGAGVQATVIRIYCIKVFMFNIKIEKKTKNKSVRKKSM